MDDERFDQITASLATASTRRSGLFAAAAAAAALALGADLAAARSRPRPEGPCGNGSRTANRCTKNGECCSGICDTGTGKANKDGEGRCRCRRRGQQCTEDRNCCNRRGQAMTCVGGVCGEICIALGQGCVTGGTACCAGSCPVAGAGWERGFAAVCCLANGQSGCTEDSHCCQNAGQLICGSDGLCVQLD